MNVEEAIAELQALRFRRGVDSTFRHPQRDRVKAALRVLDQAEARGLRLPEWEIAPAPAPAAEVDVIAAVDAVLADPPAEPAAPKRRRKP